MVIHNKTVMIYDIEVFPNTFHCVLLNTDNEELYKFEISERKIKYENLYNSLQILNIYYVDIITNTTMMLLLITL